MMIARKKQGSRRFQLAGSFVPGQLEKKLAV